MLDFNQIYLIISTEWKTYHAGFFLNAGFYMWVAHIVSNTESIGKKVFWMMFSLLLLSDILQSNIILFNYLFYVAISIFITNFDLILNPIKTFIKNKQQKAYKKYQECIAKNEFIENQEAKEQREKEKLILEANQQKQEERFLNNLSKKLDSF